MPAIDKPFSISHAQAAAIEPPEHSRTLVRRYNPDRMLAHQHSWSPATRPPLRQPAFLTLWAAQAVSAAGSQVTLLALPLTAVLSLDAGAGQMGFLRAAQTSPFLLFGLLAGVWVDRLPRRPIMIGADLGRMLLLATIPIAVTLDRLGIVQLYVVGFLVGALTLCFTVASGALLPSVVGREQLVAANSNLFASDQVVAATGPGLAGWLVQRLTAPLAIMVDVLSFGISALILAAHRSPELPAAAATTQPSVWVDLREGLRFVWSTEVVRAVALAMGAYNIFGGMGSAEYVLYATDTLAISPGVLGVVLAMGGVGGVVGALVAARLARGLGVGRTLIGALLLAGCGTVAAPLAALEPGVAAPLLAMGLLVFGTGSVIFSITAVSFLQACTPERLLGRMTAATRLLLVGAMPVGALLGGGIAEAFGLTAALAVATGGAMVAVPLLWHSPVRGIRKPPVADDAAVGTLEEPAARGEHGGDPEPDFTSRL